MIKISFTNEIRAKDMGWFEISLISLFISFMTILVFIKPESANLIGTISTITLTGLSVIVLFITLKIYIQILNVSEQTLSFTKTQTTFNALFDNFKYFDDLAKRPIPMIPELIEMENDSDSMAFYNVHFKLLKMLKEFPNNKSDNPYESSFRTFVNKIQSLIDILYDEIYQIRNSENLSAAQKNNLINLYRSYILNDYIKLCPELIENKKMFESDILPPIEIYNLLKCNKHRINIDIDAFLKLYFEVEKPV